MSRPVALSFHCLQVLVRARSHLSRGEGISSSYAAISMRLERRFFPAGIRPVRETAASRQTRADQKDKGAPCDFCAPSPTRRVNPDELLVRTNDYGLEHPERAR